MTGNRIYRLNQFRKNSAQGKEKAAGDNMTKETVVADKHKVNGRTDRLRRGRQTVLTFVPAPTIRPPTWPL
jgi:hypothetical protein